MMVTITPHGPGFFVATPQDSKHWKAYAKHMKSMGEAYDGSAYFQSDEYLPDCIKEHEEYEELGKGYRIELDVDLWEYGYWLGYDAHEVELPGEGA